LGRRRIAAISIIIFVLLLFILTANGFVPGGSGNTIRHNTQNNTAHSNKTAHKITKTIKDIYYTQYIQIKLQTNTHKNTIKYN
jgi:hypothetical protein